MTFQRLKEMVDVLKEDRKNEQVRHKAALAKKREEHEALVQKERTIVQEAVEKCDGRVAQILTSHRARERLHDEKVKDLEKCNADLHAAHREQRRLTMEAKAELAATALRQEEEFDECITKQSTLRSQLWESNKKNTEQMCFINDARLKHESQIETLKNEHECAMEELMGTQNDLQEAASRAQRQARLFRIVCAVMVTRARSAASTSGITTTTTTKTTEMDESVESKRRIPARRRKQKPPPSPPDLIDNETTVCTDECSSVNDVPPKVLSLSLRDADGLIAQLARLVSDLKHEIDCKDHLIAESRKRIDSVERQLKESNIQVQRLKQVRINVGRSQDAATKRNELDIADVVPRSTTYAPSTTAMDNFNYTQANYAHSQQNGYHTHPNGPVVDVYTDPVVETVINQAYSTLTCLANVARNASHSRRTIELAQARMYAMNTNSRHYS
jgi:hypothetical protein